jgi:hypothetical protein
MHLHIYKTKNKKYAFSSGPFFSEIHASVLPTIKHEYDFAWQALADARNLSKSVLNSNSFFNKFSQEDISTVVNYDLGKRVCNHYWEVYDGLVDVAHGSKDAEKKIRDASYKKIKIVVKSILEAIKKLDKDQEVSDEDMSHSIQELRHIINLLGGLTKECFNDLLSSELKSTTPENQQQNLTKEASANIDTTENSLSINLDMPDVLEYYAQKSCASMQSKHPDVLYLIKPENNSFEIVLNDSRQKLLSVSVDNKTFFINGIKPFNSAPDFDSKVFYQTFWRQIVSSVGNFLLPNNQIIMGGMYLPDSCESDKKLKLKTFDLERKTPTEVSISFTKYSSNQWKIGNFVRNAIDENSFSESDLIGKDGKGVMVVCIDSTQESLYQKTGQVLSCFTDSGDIYAFIDFGGQVIRLKSNKFEILDV